MYIHKYLHTYICIHIQMNTYIHIYIHSYICIQGSDEHALIQFKELGKLLSKHEDNDKKLENTISALASIPEFFTLINSLVRRYVFLYINMHIYDDTREEIVFSCIIHIHIYTLKYLPTCIYVHI
jgi:hypothetical protein